MANKQQNGKSQKVNRQNQNRGYSRGKSTRGSNRRSRSEEKFDRNSRDEGTGSGRPNYESNPSSWYTRYGDLADYAGRSSFVLFPGQVHDGLYDNNLLANDELTTTYYNYTFIPGIMAVHYIPAFGMSADAQSPISIAARELYAKVRKNFSNNLRIDAPDLFIHIGAMTNVFSYIAYLKRLYRTISSFNPTNRSYPDGLLQALGYTPAQADELVNQKNDLFNYINQLIYSSQSFIVPNEFDIINRQVWLNDTVFLDENNIQSQIYVMVPEGFYTFALLETPDAVPAGGLEFKPFSPATQAQATNISQWLYDYGNDMIKAIISWTAEFDINGYLLKVYDGASLFSIAPLSYDERLEATYSPEFLFQIHNSTALPTNLPTDVQLDFKVDVSQDPNTNALLCDSELIVKSPSGALAGSLTRTSPTVELPIGITDPTSIIEATRLMSRFTILKGDAYPYNANEEHFKVSGSTEVVTRYIVYRPANHEVGALNGWLNAQFSGLWYFDNFTRKIDPFTLIAGINGVTKFNYSPMPAVG